MTSDTRMPSSACFKTATICSTENRFRFVANLPLPTKFAEKLTLRLIRNSYSGSERFLHQHLQQVTILRKRRF
jgi:hypothetical protein